MNEIFYFWYNFFVTSAQVSQKYMFGAISHLEIDL